MKLITISGSPMTTCQFGHDFSQTRKTLVSSDIHVLIHQRRSANPPQYAVADVRTLSHEEHGTIKRHFPDASYTILPDGIGDNDIAFLARTSL